jgi:hypothetical protein
MSPTPDHWVAPPRIETRFIPPTVALVGGLPVLGGNAPLFYEPSSLVRVSGGTTCASLHPEIFGEPGADFVSAEEADTLGPVGWKWRR